MMSLFKGVTTFDGVAVNSIEERPAAEAVTAAAMDRAGWTCTADSENIDPPNPCGNVLDGDAGTIWHSKWTDPAAPLPHQITIDMQASALIGSITYQPRAENGNGNIGQHIISTR